MRKDVPHGIGYLPLGTPTLTADFSGTYTAQLIVNDGTVSSAPNTVNISVNFVDPQVRFLSGQYNLLNSKAEQQTQRRLVRLPSTKPSLLFATLVSLRASGSVD